MSHTWLRIDARCQLWAQLGEHAYVPSPTEQSQGTGLLPRQPGVPNTNAPPIKPKLRCLLCSIASGIAQHVTASFYCLQAVASLPAFKCRGPRLHLWLRGVSTSWCLCVRLFQSAIYSPVIYIAPMWGTHSLMTSQKYPGLYYLSLKGCPQPCHLIQVLTNRTLLRYRSLSKSFL